MSLSEFKSLFSDLLRPNYFEVLIEPPKKLSGIDTTSFRYLIQSTDFPFETIIPKEFIALSRKYKIAGNADYDPFTINFYLDSQGKLLDFFEKWKKLVINDENKMGYYNDYVGNISIKMLDRKLNNIFEVKIFDCFPVNRNNIPLSYQTTDAFIEFAVSFEYFRAEYLYNGVQYSANYDPAEFESITQIYNVVSEITSGFNIQTKTYGSNGSPLGGDFFSFNPFQEQVGKAIDKLGQQLNNTLSGIGLPKSSSFGNTLTSAINDKIKSASKAITQPIQSAVNQLQNSISSKYKQIQQQTTKRIQTSIQKTVNKIFKF